MKKRFLKVNNNMMDYPLKNLILHYVAEEDLAEVARTWPADHHPLSDTEAREAIAYMREITGGIRKAVSFTCAWRCAGRMIPEQSWDGADWTVRGIIQSLKSSFCWTKHTGTRDTEPNA